MPIETDDSITQILKQTILESPELLKIIDDRAKAIVQNSDPAPVQDLTRKQLADLWQISIKTLDRMSDEEVQDNGYIRRRRGVPVRFERISSRELYNRIKNKE